MRAPASRQARATAARRVSIETTTSAPGQALDHRQDALQFLVGIDRPRARPRRLAADIDDVGALRNETQAIVDGLRWVEAFAAVGKRVRRHIDDRHDPRAIEGDAGEACRQTPGCGSGLAPGDGPAPWPELVGTEARRRRSAGAGAAGVVAHDLLAAQDRADLVVAERLVLEQRLGDEVQVVEMVGQDLRALPSASSIRRRTSWSISWAVASETFCVWVTAWPRNTSCSLAW